MGEPRGFLQLQRARPVRRPVEERVRHWGEFYEPLPAAAVAAEGARCMDCGVPFCHGDTGCPLHNAIPDWNDLVYRGRWREALAALHATNNFPEFTGRLCPAPCESACVLGIIGEPVAIRNVEQSIIDRGFAEGWVSARGPARESGRRVGVIGSGPAGLAAAQQLRRAGHAVTLFERDDRAGGLLRYGIPDFKMEKGVLDRRLAQMAAEGVVFATGVDAGVDVTAADLRRDFDAVCITTGAAAARDIRVPGRELRGIHLAMDFLAQQNRRVAGDAPHPAREITATAKRVVVIGGGDTGSDCVGTSHRQGAVSVTQLELLPQPPLARAESTPWPLWPMQLRTSHAHEEGGAREWSVSTTAFGGEDGAVRRLHAVRVEPYTSADGRPGFRELPGSAFTLDADLVLLAMGFTGPVKTRLLDELGVEMSARGTVAVDHRHRTSVPGVFAAGDVARGASLVVWAIREGRDVAAQVDAYLRSEAPACRQ